MRILVVTVVHHPLDARIYFREMAALLEHGYQITYAAAFDSFQVNEIDPRIELITLPRAVGKRRLSALIAARKLLKVRSIDFDLVLLHDPELLLVASSSKKPVVWDVHEDTVAAISSKTWIPNLLKRPLQYLIAQLEQSASKRFGLILAETDYQDRFSKLFPVIPNTTSVPAYKPISPSRSVIYLGSVSTLRGGETLIAVGKQLARQQISLEIIGGCAESALSDKLNQAAENGELIWHGFMPNEKARELLVGQLAGLSLLQNQPNYLVSQPTKIYEYLAAGIPVVTTPLPQAVKLISDANCGYIVDFDNVDQVVEKITLLAEDSDLWRNLGSNGHEYVMQHHNWDVDKFKFISALEDYAAK